MDGRVRVQLRVTAALLLWLSPALKTGTRVLLYFKVMYLCSRSGASPGQNTTKLGHTYVVPQSNTQATTLLSTCTRYRKVPSGDEEARERMCVVCRMLYSLARELTSLRALEGSFDVSTCLTMHAFSRRGG